MKSISIEEVDRILTDPNKVLIDIRDNYMYQVGTIPSAINIPNNFLMMMPNQYLKKNTSYYLFCEYGSRSRKLVNYLTSLGYDVTNIDGGYSSYKR